MLEAVTNIEEKTLRNSPTKYEDLCQGYLFYFSSCVCVSKPSELPSSYLERSSTSHVVPSQEQFNLGNSNVLWPEWCAVTLLSYSNISQEQFTSKKENYFTFFFYHPKSEQIWRNVTLHHLLINGSSAVNRCHQKYDYQSTPFKVKSCVFVGNKYIKTSFKRLSRLNQGRNMHINHPL